MGDWESELDPGPGAWINPSESSADGQAPSGSWITSRHEAGVVTTVCGW
jgi:hypothetical protein